jgi:hypothetical protein
MEQVYYLASLKLSAWLGKTNTYTTEFKDARRFTRGEAIAMARRNGTLIPVSADDMAELGW